MRMKIAIALGIVYVVWGSTYLAIAVADRTLPPLLMLAVRFGLAGGLLYVWSAWRGDLAGAPLPQAPFLSAAMQMLCAAALLGVAGAAMGEVGRVHPAAISASSAAAFAFLVVFGSIVAFTAYGWLLRSGAPSVLVSTYAYVNPAVAVLLGWALAGEAVGGRALAAGSLVVASVRRRLLPRPPHEHDEWP